MRLEYLIKKAKEGFEAARPDERFVCNLLEISIGGECKKSTNYEDWHDHIDLWWKSPKNINVAIEVKGIKKNMMSDSFRDDKINWVELKNVNGYDGWLYGKSDYVAFRRFKSVIFVKTTLLRDFTDKLNIKDKKIWYGEMPQDFYIPYQRSNNKDLMYKIPTDELLKMTHFTIEHDDMTKQLKWR